MSLTSLQKVELDAELGAQQLQWASLFSRMHQFLWAQHQPGAVPKSDPDFCREVEPLRTLFLQDFTKLSRTHFDQPLARTDLLLVIQCYALCCATPALRRQARLADAGQLATRLCLLACRHTPATRAQPVDSDTVSSLMAEFASWIVQFGGHSRDVLIDALVEVPCLFEDASLAAKLQEAMEVPHLAYTESAADKAAQQERQAMEDSAHQEVLRQEAAMAAEEDYTEEFRQEDDIEQSSQKGDLWLTDGAMIAVGLLPLATRVFYHHLFEQHVFAQFPRAPDSTTFNYLPSALHKLRDAVVARCKFATGDTFGTKFREFIHMCYLPVGAYLTQYRKTQRDFLRTSAVQMFEVEIGFNAGQALYNLLKHKPLDIASDPKHELHELLALYVVDQMCRASCNFSFIESFFLHPQQLTERCAELHWTTQYHKPRRPRIVPLENKVWIHMQGAWYPCTSLIDSILRLFVMMRKAPCMKTVYPPGQVPPPLYKCLHGQGSRDMSRLVDDILGKPVHIDVFAWALQ